MSAPPVPLSVSLETSIRLLLVDDHRLLREGVRRILEQESDFAVIGETDDGHDALAMVREARPQVMVMDLSMPGLSGINLIRRIRQDHPHTMVLVLSMHAEEQYAMRTLKAGAQGYLTKDAAAEELVQAVRRVAHGGCYLSRHMAEQVALTLARHDEVPRHERLTDREFEVFRQIVMGLRMSDISRNLHLSIKTVSTHKARILQKMQLDTTAALIRYGLEHRLFGETTWDPTGVGVADGHGHGHGTLPLFDPIA